MASKDRYKTLFKFHRQFAHSPMKKLKLLLKDADQCKDEYSNLLEDISNTCELCKRYAKAPSRPVVGLPMASQVNEKVSMGLKQWTGHCVLHIIDMWSRYTVSVFIKRCHRCLDAEMDSCLWNNGVNNDRQRWGI